MIFRATKSFVGVFALALLVTASSACSYYRQKDVARSNNPIVTGQCETEANPEPCPTPRFADVTEVFKAHCLDCHRGESAPMGIDLTDYKGILEGKDSMGQDLVVSGLPDSSALFTIIDSGGMPFTGRISDGEVKLIRKWIEGGLLK